MAILGPGQGFPYPTASYPTPLYSGGVLVASAIATNEFGLPPGGIELVPPGTWWVDPGLYSQVQFLDPVSGLWRTDQSARGARVVSSDGANVRLWNPLGQPLGAIVTNVGSNYVQASTTVTPNAGASTWKAIVGGAINSTITITAGGANYTYAPTLVIDAPPAGGIQATATCTVSGGAINAVTVVDQGAGYAAVPNVTVIPNPLDPTLGSITAATLTAALTGTGQVAAVVCTNPGTPQTSVPTLTFGGAGSSAAATVIHCLTVTAVSFSNTGGAAYAGSFVKVATVGGKVTTAAGGIVNPAIGTGLLLPRQADIYAPVSAGAIGSAVITDGGMFQLAPAGLVLAEQPSAGSGLPTTISAATLTMGTATDRVVMQLVIAD